MSRSFLPTSRITLIVCVAGFRPGSRATFVSSKVAKTIDAPSGLITGDEHKSRESEPTRCAQTRFAGLSERPTRGPDGRRRTSGDEHSREPDERPRNHTFRMIPKPHPKLNMQRRNFHRGWLGTFQAEHITGKIVFLFVRQGEFWHDGSR